MEKNEEDVGNEMRETKEQEEIGKGKKSRR